MKGEYILSGLAHLQGYAQHWYLDKGVTWPSQPRMNKIDLHHHMVPDFYAQGKSVHHLLLPPHSAMTR